MWTLLFLLVCFQEESDEKQEPDVVVTATRKETNINDVPAGVTVITREQILESGADNIREIIERTPGVFIQSANKGAYDATIDMRGYANGAGNGQRTLVMVDGRRTNSVTGSSTDWATIPLDNIERIEITRGPTATLYGDPALAGVIKIFTRTGDNVQKWKTRISGGTFETHKETIELSGPWGSESTFHLFVGNEASDGWRDNSAYSATNFSAKFDLALSEEIQLFLKIGAHNDDRERPGSLYQSDIDSLGRNGTTTPNDNADRTEGNFDAVCTYLSEGSGDWSLQITTHRGSSDSTLVFSGSPPFVTSDEYEQTSLYLKNIFETDILGNFTSGLDLHYEEADATSLFTSTTDTNYVRRMIGLYENWDAKLMSWMTFMGGVRFDRALLGVDRDAGGGGFSFDTTKPFDQFSPMAGFTFHPLDFLNLYTSYGRPHKYPTRDELNGFSGSAPQLTPERSHSQEAGVRLDVKDWLRLSAAYYRMDVKNEIFFDSSFPPFGSNINFDKVRHQGVEADFRTYTIPTWGEIDFTLFGAYTYTRAVIRSNGLEGKKYPVTPAHFGSLGSTLRRRSTFLTLNGRVVGRRFAVNDFNNTATMLGSYWVGDAKIGHRTENVEFFLSVFNFSDRKYHDNAGLDFASTLKFHPAPERSFLAGMNAEF